MKQNGGSIEAIRAAQGRTKAWLARQVGCHRSTICRIESEERGAGDDTLRRIADALHVDIGAITKGEPRDQEA